MKAIEMQPPKIPFGKDVPSRKTHVFLAGSIEMGTALDWQREVFKRIENYNAYVYNPRRDNWDSSQENTIENPYFKEQVEWELMMQDCADIIFMHFEPYTKAAVTMLEFGLFIESGKLIVSCPDGFWRKGNIEVTCDYFNVPLYNEMDAAIGHLERELIKREDS